MLLSLKKAAKDLTVNLESRECQVVVSVAIETRLVNSESRVKRSAKIYLPKVYMLSWEKISVIFVLLYDFPFVYSAVVSFEIPILQLSAAVLWFKAIICGHNFNFPKVHFPPWIAFILCPVWTSIVIDDIFCLKKCLEYIKKRKKKKDDKNDMFKENNLIDKWTTK